MGQTRLGMHCSGSKRCSKHPVRWFSPPPWAQSFIQNDDHTSKMKYGKDTHQSTTYNGAKIRSHAVGYS